MFKWLKKCIPQKSNRNNKNMKKQEVIMIAAIQNDRGIGYQNNLIHSIKNDMKHFVDQTTGHTVIMGRKNWETIPEKYRPFKNRENIIITRDSHYSAPGAIIVNSLEEAIEKSTGDKIYIIGGGQIYALGMKYANTLDLTHIDANNPSDIFFPEHEHEFHVIKSSGKIHDEKTDLDYVFKIWERK